MIPSRNLVPSPLGRLSKAHKEKEAQHRDGTEQDSGSSGMKEGKKEERKRRQPADAER